MHNTDKMGKKEQEEKEEERGNTVILQSTEKTSSCAACIVRAYISVMHAAGDRPRHERGILVRTYGYLQGRSVQGMP